MPVLASIGDFFFFLSRTSFYALLDFGCELVSFKRPYFHVPFLVYLFLSTLIQLIWILPGLYSVIFYKATCPMPLGSGVLLVTPYIQVGNTRSLFTSSLNSTFLVRIGSFGWNRSEES